MFKRIIKFLSSVGFSIYLTSTVLHAEIVNQIEVNGNDRVSNESILMFSKIQIGDDLNQIKINNALKNIYESNFFSDVKIKLKANKLSIFVVENPVIENIEYQGIKSKTLIENLTKNLKLKSRSSYDVSILNNDVKQINFLLKELGYYFSKVEVNKIDLSDNRLKLIYNIELGEKAKIKKIIFLGDKKFKDSKLKSLITSEEYKFWKFISGKKYLNENLINFDKRLLKNFYLNKGYYDVKINSSFAKLINNDEFELVFNINANKKFFFDNLSIVLPDDFEPNNFNDLKIIFDELKDKPYSINSVEQIINEIDKISINEQFESVKASVSENIIDNKINLIFKIEETEKFFVEKINIYGNNITRESVIRNKFLVDEGDPYNEILANRTVNEIKSLNFFRDVEFNVINGDKPNSKIINISVIEKPTGEIMAGAGFGTDGEVLEIGVRENNYLGKGLSIDTNLLVSSDKISGQFNIINPNYNNSDKTLTFGVQALESDKLSDFGYKSNKIGSLIGTNFEYLEDFKFGLEASSFLEKIETNSTASARQKTQEGNYFDTYVNLDFDYDKRNQKFQTSDGFRSFYSIDVPLVSETNTLVNYYNYKIYSELYENNISSLSISLSAANSLTGDDIKLSERLYIPQKKLRGFVRGKVGPKDGTDYIGGNYYTTVNLNTSLPQVFPNLQNLDVGAFFDIANLWGVDDATLNDSNELRSSVGIGVDWFTPVGPLSFTFAQPITKGSTDSTETFRFNLGTTF
ncbi:outer membrane protein assembly factor BamA [Candidatus Pelagibacter sp.]|mgnify:CR=1 FL=1|uniref:outer membrane protein assembly factor BamA n=1 Tax=Candidatus Pelagibacter sp. TaxID=2024849 RepID=UPI003F833BF4|tara:strand:+ start:1986 stop:4232 length:2247 start_codon:yes stop_codon:yes gene_type:complete